MSEPAEDADAVDVAVAATGAALDDAAEAPGVAHEDAAEQQTTAAAKPADPGDSEPQAELEEARAAAAAPAEAADITQAAAPADDAKLSSEDEGLLDRWVEAKRSKDFATADKLREELRARGIEPDQVRPNNKKGAAPQTFDDETERKLSQWVAAKRAKDFATADRIRDELRTQGVDPDKVRPATNSAPPPPQPAAPYGYPPPHHGGRWGGGGWGGGGWGGGGGYGEYGGGYGEYGGWGPQFDRHTEARLTEWVQAKRSKDFATADKIREEYAPCCPPCALLGVGRE